MTLALKGFLFSEEIYMGDVEAPFHINKGVDVELPTNGIYQMKSVSFIPLMRGRSYGRGRLNITHIVRGVETSIRSSQQNTYKVITSNHSRIILS